MIRRSFIKTISLFSLSPLISWERLFGLTKSSQSIKDSVKEIFAYNLGNTFQLHSEDPELLFREGPPLDWTWRDLLKKGFGEIDENLTEDYLENEWELSLTDLDELCDEDEVKRWWEQYGLDTTSEVFDYLLDLDLSDDLKKQLIWYEYPNMCSTYVGVEASDEKTINQLEQELKKLGKNVRLRVIEDWVELC